MKRTICTVHTKIKNNTNTLQTVVAKLCGGTYDSTSGCCNDWGRDTGDMSRFDAINRNVVYAMPHVGFKIPGKFGENFVGALIDRLQGRTMRVHSYINERLVDTGSATSIFPSAWADRLQPATTYSLQTPGKGLLPVIGRLHTSADLGFARLFSHDFHVCDIKFGILGADFLSRHKLIVDVTHQRLTESIEVERCSPSTDLEPDPSFGIQTNNKTNLKILNSPQKTFPEVFDPCGRNRETKHAIVVSVQTSTEEPVFACVAF